MLEQLYFYYLIYYQSKLLTVMDCKTNRILGRRQSRERWVVFQKMQIPRLCPILYANIAKEPPLYLQIIFYDRKWVFPVIKEGKNFKLEVLPCFFIMISREWIWTLMTEVQVLYSSSMHIIKLLFQVGNFVNCALFNRLVSFNSDFTWWRCRRGTEASEKRTYSYQSLNRNHVLEPSLYL